MRRRNFYLVRPKQKLMDSQDGADDFLFDALREPQLWESDEGGRTAWTHLDYVARVKLAFMIYLKTEYPGAKGIERLFSGRRVSTRLFDEYWNIEPLEFGGNVSEIADETLSPQEVEMTGAAVVDAWLARKVASKGTPGEPARKKPQ